MLWCSGALEKEPVLGSDYKSGLAAVAMTFLGYSALQGPSSVMVRPHPVVWKLVHGIAILYLLSLVFLLFQGKDEARALLQVRPSCPHQRWQPPAQSPAASIVSHVCGLLCHLQHPA